MLAMMRSAKGGKRTGAEAAETGPQSRTSGAERDTGQQVKFNKEDKLWDGRWRMAGGGDVQVES